MAVDSVKSALQADFAAAREAFGLHNFTLMNVMANRLMGNVLFSSTKHRRYILPGFLVKTVALELDQMPSEGHETNEVLDAAEELLNRLEQMFGDKATIEDAWTAYGSYQARSRLMRAVPAERKAYEKENFEFTALAIDYIFQRSLADIDGLCRVDSGIVRSSLSETDRALRTHGCTLSDLILHSLLVSFSRIFEYRYFEAMPPNGDFNSDELKVRIRPSLDALLNAHKDIRSDARAPVEVGTTLLETFVLEWRELFLRYYEIREPRHQAQRPQIEPPKIELPEAAKEQITESVKRAMEEELTPRREPKN